MNDLISYDQNFIKTLFENSPDKIINLSIPENRKNKKVSSLISLAEKYEVKVTVNSTKKISAVYKPSIAKDMNYLEKIIQQKENPIILILDHVMDPQNVGSILRTSLAASVDAVVVSKNRACHLTETVRKVSKGASELIPFIIVNNIKNLTRQLQKIGLNVIGCDIGEGINYYDFNFKKATAIIMGAEDKGIQFSLKKELDEIINIPMNNKIESLNVSNACSVILFEMRKQRS
tara:strand:- start:5081 stop:5779 length:699 start_codon:yes stop_codon:yes gene_type:complete